MSKKVSIENLGDYVSGILEEYADNIDANIAEVTKKVGQSGVKALKAESESHFNGHKYAKSWTYATYQGRLYTTVVIYNKKPGLPHLLEYGHAMVSGGRHIGDVKGRAHIEPVEQELIETYQKEVISKL